MASWFTASNSSLDDQVEKATESSLEDMALNLEISDIIRSKTVQPKEAMRSLRKRIGHKNPNVQLAALNLTDTCVKNGGSHFLTEIASREFMDNLVSLLKAPNAIDPKVESKMLELIQTWASAFEGQPHLSYANQIYRQLQTENFRFPPPTKVSSTFVDSSAPPDWTDSDVCMRCRTPFTFTNRKHHCRNCGNTFCGTCSSKSIPLPHIGIVQAVRVCDGCHTKLTERRAPVTPLGSPKHHGSHSQRHTTSKPKAQSTPMQPRNARVEDDDDEDLKMALKMSLEEATGKPSAGYVSQQQLQAQKLVTQATSAASYPEAQPSKPVQPTRQGNPPEEDEDEELKAAIAASLRDMEEQKAKSAWSNPSAAAKSTGSQASIVRRPDHELSPGEAENINLFATLVDRLQTQPPGTILREPQIQELYESIGTLRPKLARTFGETMSKYEALCDLHAKLGTVVRYYDRMLEERLSYTYGRHGVSSPSPYQQPSSSSNAYPTLPSAENYYGRSDSSVPQTNYPPPQTNYQNYYTQPHTFDKQGSFPGQPEPQPGPQAQYQQTPSQAPYQYNGYDNSNPPPQNDSTTSPAQQPSEPPSAPVPRQQPLHQQHTGPSAQHQQSIPTSQPLPENSYWQYPKTGQEPGYQYPYSPHSQQQIPWQQGSSAPPGGGQYTYPPPHGVSEASASTPVQNPPPQSQPKVVEESLIDL